MSCPLKCGLFNENVMKSLEYLGMLYKIADEAETDASFLYALTNYLGLLLDNDELDAIFTSLIAEQQNKDKEQLLKMEAEIKDKAIDMYKFLSNFIKKEKTKDPEVQKYLTECKQFIKGELLISGNPTDNYLGVVTRLLIAMYDSENDKVKEFAKQFATFDDDGMLVRWSWYESVDFYEREKGRLERIAPTRAWHWWENFSYFYEVFVNLEKHWDDARGKHQYMSLYGLAEVKDELQKTLSGRMPEKFYFIHPKQLRFQLKQFHTALLIQASRIEQTPQDQDNKMPVVRCEISPDQIVLTYLDQSIPFRCDSNRYDVLKYLLEHKSFDPVSWEEVAEHIDKNSFEDNADPWRGKIYNANLGINEQVQLKLGLPKLLKHDKKQVFLNPIYDFQLLG